LKTDYSDEGLIGEYAQDGTPIKTYSWLPDSTWGTNPLTLTENGQTYYYHNDHLGTPQRLTDEQGNTVWSATYDAFGKATVAPSSTITSSLRFPGQYFDEETGLHYNWNRYYDPVAGRYISTDPLGFAAGDSNLYRYVANSPVNAIDPKGLYCDGWQIASNLAAGFGDGISFGLTAKLRQKLGTDHVVNKCSGLYKTSHFAGEAVTGYLLGAGIAKAGGWAIGKVGPRLERFFGSATKGERALVAGEESLATSNVENTITDSLQQHANRAIAEVDSLPQSQVYTSKQIRAMNRNPNLAEAYRGNRIDVRTRQYVKNDESLSHLKSNYTRGPDFVDSKTGQWWDMTTERQWQKHINKYGNAGTRLRTERL
jgi:RHS repeat-associated protein